MSEQPDESREPVDEGQPPRADAGEVGGGRGSVRTPGETSVDEAMGAEDEPIR